MCRIIYSVDGCKICKKIIRTHMPSIHSDDHFYYSNKEKDRLNERYVFPFFSIIQMLFFFLNRGFYFI